MNTIKNTPTFKYLFFLIVFAIAALSSCKNNDDEVNASLKAHVMVTNAAEGSSPQDMYADDSKVNSSAVAYAQSSSYSDVNAGDHQAKFVNSGSSTANATFSLSLQSGQYYSVYYTGGGTGSANYVVAQDDMSAPASGKAKVRFIHLSSAAAASVDFGLSAANKLVTGLAYRAASAYYTVDANSTFSLFAAGSATAALSIPTTIQAGKIYTIYVSGTSNTSISYHIIAQN